MAWTNSDGLRVRFGREEATVGTVGEYVSDGALREVEATLDLSTLTATAGGTILSDTVTIPNGAFIDSVEIFVTEAAAGATADLNIGLVDQDRTTEIDFNGLVAAADVATLTAGAKLTLVVGSTAAGALIGTELTNAGLLVADYDTAAFTDGTVRITVRYRFV